MNECTISDLQIKIKRLEETLKNAEDAGKSLAKQLFACEKREYDLQCKIKEIEDNHELD